MTDPEPAHVDALSALRRFLDVPFRAQTYRNLAYLALAFPLGLGYFVGVTTGLSLGVGLLVTLVGIPVLVLTLFGTTVLAGFEANLARWLLDMDVPTPRAVEGLEDGSIPTDVDGLLESLTRFLTASTTWTSLVLVGLKFVFGVVAFVALTIVGTVVATMLSAPFFYDVPGVMYNIGPYVVDTAAEGTLLAIGGLLALLVGLHVLNGLARFFGLVTATLLGSDANTTSSTVHA